jgi:small subunit ribosomal protein S21
VCFAIKSYHQGSFDLKALEGGDDMPHVRVRDGEPFDRAFRRFTKSCEKAGILSELRRKQRFEKPSETKKRLMNQARRKQRKLLSEQRRAGLI